MPLPPFTPHQAKLLRQGIELFNNGKFFECHEALEEAWLESSGDQKTMLQGLIQVAVSFHHLRRENFVGASRLLDAGIKKLKPFVAEVQTLNLEALLSHLAPLLELLAAGGSETAFPAPLLTFTE